MKYTAWSKFINRIILIISKKKSLGLSGSGTRDLSHQRKKDIHLFPAGLEPATFRV